MQLRFANKIYTGQDQTLGTLSAFVGPVSILRCNHTQQWDSITNNITSTIGTKTSRDFKFIVKHCFSINVLLFANILESPGGIYLVNMTNINDWREAK